MLTNSNFYIGDSSISRLYQGDNLVWDSSHPDILLEYIDNGTASTQPNVFFSTGVSGGLDRKIEIKFSYHTQLTDAVLMGVGEHLNNTSYNYISMYANSALAGKSTMKFWYRQVDGYCQTVPSVDTPHILTTYGTYTSNSAASAVHMILDGEKTSRSYTISNSVAGTGSMYLFARHNALDNTQTADMYAPASTRIYYTKIWIDNRLVRFYIPVLHYIDGQYTPCFYDKVYGFYIYNLGTDTPTYKISGDYLLNYIQCGNDYLDQSTGTRCYIRYNPQLPVDLGYEFHMKVNPGNAYYNSPAAPQESFIIGERVTGTAKIGFYMPNGNYGIRTGWLNAVYTLWSGNPAGNDFRISWTINQSDRKRSAWVNDSSVQNAGTEVSSVPEELVGANIYINKCGAANVWAGNKYYYIIIDKFTINQRTYVPVLHNGQAMFLDLSNSTYMQHTVDSGGGTDNTLLYSF